MTSAMLTKLLAERAMGWRSGRGRYLIGGGQWIAQNQFQPLTRVEDAFKVLRRLDCAYSLAYRGSGVFAARVNIGQRAGEGSGRSEALALTLAAARALDIDVENLD